MKRWQWLIGLLFALSCTEAKVEILRQGDRCLVVRHPPGCAGAGGPDEIYTVDCTERPLP